VFIAGTDTDVGKTMVTVALIKYLRTVGVDAVGLKPVCCGVREDAEKIQYANALNGGVLHSIDSINPVYLTEPAAPASIAQANVAPLQEVLDQIHTVETEFQIVEGAGGWLVPVCHEWDMEALAVQCGHPVLLVVSNRLGALNHAALTAQAIRATGLPLVGFVLNTIAPSSYPLAQQTNLKVLEELLDCPCLAAITPGGNPASSQILNERLKIQTQEDLPLLFAP